MKNILSALLVSTLIVLPVAADGWEFETGYSRVAASDGGADLNFGSLYGIAGYQWEHSRNYSSSAEVLLAVGIQDDDIFGLGIELSSNLGAGYKGTWQTSSDDVQLFWRVNYTQLTIDAAGPGNDVSADESDIGLGVGLVWKHLTIGYTSYQGDLDDFDAINIGYKF